MAVSMAGPSVHSLADHWAASKADWTAGPTADCLVALKAGCSVDHWVDQWELRLVGQKVASTAVTTADTLAVQKADRMVAHLAAHSAGPMVVQKAVQLEWTTADTMVD